MEGDEVGPTLGLKVGGEEGDGVGDFVAVGGGVMPSLVLMSLIRISCSVFFLVRALLLLLRLEILSDCDSIVAFIDSIKASYLENRR